MCAAAKGLVFTPFWSEIGYGFRGSHGSVWTYLSFPFQMSKKEREICEIKMGFLEVFFCCCSNLSNDDIISKRSGLKMGMDFRGQVWKRVWKMTFIYRTGWHTPTKNSQEYPWGCGRVTLESIFLSRVEGRGFHVEGEGTMSRVEGNIFFSNFFFLEKVIIDAINVIKTNKKNLKNKWRVNIF